MSDSTYLSGVQRYVVSAGYDVPTPDATKATVLGGTQNVSSGQDSVVVGGTANTASGSRAVDSGGNSRTASNADQWVAGSLSEAN